MKGNFSDNSQNYYDLEQILIDHGSLLPLDIFNLYPYLLVSVLGFLLSLFSFIVFQSDKFKIPFYEYMRVYTLNGTIACLVSIFNCFNSSIRIVSFSNSFLVQAYNIYVFLPIASTTYFYGSVLDILILIDRLSYFNAGLKCFTKIKPYTLCVISFFICLIIQIPSFLFYRISSSTYPIDSTTNFTLWEGQTTDFAVSAYGYALMIVVYALRDLTAMIIQIILNAACLRLLKNQLNRKQSYLARIYSSGAYSTEIKATLTAVVLCLISIIEHLINLTSCIYPYIRMNLVANILFDVVNFVWVFKRAVEFFVLIALNSSFRRGSVNLLNRITLRNKSTNVNSTA